MARNIDRTKNTVKPKFDYRVSPPVVDTNRVLQHANATRIKYNAVDAEKFNEMERLLYELVDLIGDCDTDFNDVEETSEDLLTVGDKIRDIVNFVKFKLSTTFIATHARLVLGQGVIRRFKHECIVTKRGAPSSMDLMTESGFAITPEAVSYNITGTKLTFDRSETYQTTGYDPFSPVYCDPSEVVAVPIQEVDVGDGDMRRCAFVGNKFIVNNGLEIKNQDGEITGYCHAVVMIAEGYPDSPFNEVQSSIVVSEYDGTNIGTDNDSETVIDLYNGMLINLEDDYGDSVFVWYKTYTYRVDAICVGSNNNGVPYKTKGTAFLPPYAAYTVNGFGDVTDSYYTDPTDYSYPEPQASDSALHYVVVKPTLNTESMPWIPDAWSSASIYNTGDKVSYNSVVYISLTDGNNNNNPESTSGFWSASSNCSNYVSSLYLSTVIDNRTFIDPSNLLLDSIYNHARSGFISQADNLGGYGTDKELKPLKVSLLTAFTPVGDSPSSDRTYTLKFYQNGEVISSPLCYQLIESTGGEEGPTSTPLGQDTAIMLTISNGATAIDASTVYADWNTDTIYTKDEMVVADDKKYKSLKANNQGNDPTSEPPTWWSNQGNTSETTVSITRSSEPTNPYTIYLPDVAVNETVDLYIATDGSTYYDVEFTQLAAANPNSKINQDRRDGYGIKSDHVQKQSIIGTGDAWDKDTSYDQKANEDALGHIALQSVGSSELVTALLNQRHFPDAEVKGLSTDSLIDAMFIKDNSIDLRMLNKSENAKKIDYHAIQQAGIRRQNIKGTKEVSQTDINGRVLYYSTNQDVGGTIEDQINFNINRNISNHSMFLTALAYNCTYTGTSLVLTQDLYIVGTKNFAYWNYTNAFSSKYIKIPADTYTINHESPAGVVYIKLSSYNVDSVSDIFTESVTSYVPSFDRIVIGTCTNLQNGYWAITFMNGVILMSDGTKPYTAYFE